MIEPRHEVQNFSFAMEEKLRENDHVKTAWNDCTNGYLLDRLQEEVAELHRALINGRKEQICREAADVANFAMMLHDNNSRK